MMNLRKTVVRKFPAMIAGLAMAVLASAAHAVTINFTQITANGATGGVNQLSVDATYNGAGGVLFDFNVVAGVNTNLNVAEIYLSDEGALFVAPLTQSQITVQIGTNFTAGAANPGDLPGGGTNFDVTAGLLADAEGTSSNGLTIGDDLQFYLNLAGVGTFADFLASLDDGSFRIGLHVRSHFDGGSEGYVSTPPGGGGGGGVLPPIPLPAGMPLLLGALGLLGLVRRKFNKAA